MAGSGPPKLKKGPVECANPLFHQWLKAWQDQAYAAGNLNMVHVYKKAADAMRKHPVPLSSGRAAQQLSGIGVTISAKLQRRFEQHVAAGLPLSGAGSKPSQDVAPHMPIPGGDGAYEVPEQSSQVSIAGQLQRCLSLGDSLAVPVARPSSAPRDPANYTPKYGSGAFALLAALVALEATMPTGVSEGIFSKEAIVQYTEHAAAWSAMGQLVRRGLVDRQSTGYVLASSGRVAWRRARQRYAEEEVIKKAPLQARETIPVTCGASLREGTARASADATLLEESDTGDLQSETSGTQSVSEGEMPEMRTLTHAPDVLDAKVALEAGTFDVVLVIDSREAQSYKDTTAVLETYLGAEGIPYVYRALPIGDFMWICKAREGGDSGAELALDYIVERKREDDLVSSIIDGRFDEQKFRLGRSGFRHVIYVIERHGKQHGHHGHAVDRFGKGRFLAAVLATQVHNAYFVKTTDSFSDTLDYLRSMTRALTRKYADRHMRAMPPAWVAAAYDVGGNAAFARNQERTPTHRTTLPAYKLASPVYHCAYADFARLHGKAALLTHHDLYVKQLARVRFMSFEKAVAVAARYTTFAHLVAAYDACSDTLTRQHLLSDIVYAPPDRKLGPKLSARVHACLCVGDPTDSGDEDTVVSTAAVA